MTKKENKYFILDKAESSGVKNTVKHILYEFLALKYKLKMEFATPEIKAKKYNVSICAIFKNEASYLKEWIEFHHIVGVDHFYLYNNNSEDNFMKILQPYIENNWVTLVEWPHNQMQMEAYMDGIKNFSSETKWLGFIDIDEFIVPKSTDNIYDFLKPFEKNRGSVNIYWKLYGTSGLTDRDLTGLVTEDFTICWPKYCDIGKCFYNTAFGFNCESGYSSGLHHRFWASWGGKDIPPVNIFDKICIGSRNIAHVMDFPIQINHYFTKSYKEYAMKCAKGDVYFKINPHDEAYFLEHEMKCTSVDYAAYKYLIKLKSEIEKSK